MQKKKEKLTFKGDGRGMASYRQHRIPGDGRNVYDVLLENERIEIYPQICKMQGDRT